MSYKIVKAHALGHFVGKKRKKNLLFSVYTDANVWPKARVENPALG